MQGIHTVHEYATVSELDQMLEIVKALLTR